MSRPFQIALLALLATVAGQGLAAPQVLPRHAAAAAAASRPEGRLPPERRLTFALALPLRNAAALTTRLEQVSNPASPEYGRYLTPETFAAQFAPLPRDYQALTDYARSNGFEIVRTHPNRTLLTVAAPVARIERAFRVTLRTYRHPREGRLFHAPDADLSLDAPTRVLAVSGLDDFAPPRPLAHARPAAVAPQGGSGPGGSFLGYDFRSAYYVSNGPLTGAGQSVGLLQFDGYNPADITAYKTMAGLPDVTVTNILLDGFSGAAGINNDEVCLDIEMAIAMAPGLARVIVYASNPTNAVPNDILNQMATDNAARQLSSSWTWSPRDAAADQIFQQMALQGQSFFQASGDSDAYTNGAANPADNPYVTVVGGTTLSTTSGRLWSSERVWNWGLYNGQYWGSGGGTSTVYAMPSWQSGISMATNQGSTVMRNLPDVAMVADQVYVRYGSGTNGIFGGTSCAAPLWAAFTALVNEQAARNARPPVGFLNPALYALGKGTNYAAVFHDITVSNNFSAFSPTRYAALPGYDLCTGWGTPRGSNTIEALAPFNALRITPLTTPAFISPTGGVFAPATVALVLTNAGSVPLAWSAGCTSAWFGVQPTGGTLAAGATASVTVMPTAEAGALAAGVYAATLWFTNSVGGTEQGRELSLIVCQPTVANADFETSDATNWLASGTSGGNVVVDRWYWYDNLHGSYFVHGGYYGMTMGTKGSLGYISQTLQTVAGRPYLLSFWLTNPRAGTPNEFVVQWGDQTLLHQVDMGAFGWSNAQFLVTAAAPTTVLKFGARNDVYEFALDDVLVQMLSVPVLEAPVSGGVAGRLAWSATTNVHYQLQYSSALDPLQWIDLGAPVAGTGDVVTATDPEPDSTQRFYRVILQP